MKKSLNKIAKKVISVKTILISKSGEGFVDTSIKILISVIIGALVLAGLYTLFNTTVMPSVTSKVTSMFSYNG
jgi:hypothetical protein